MAARAESGGRDGRKEREGSAVQPHTKAAGTEVGAWGYSTWKLRREQL